jgi:hypothetical protein
MIKLIDSNSLINNYCEDWDNLSSLDKRGDFFSSSRWIRAVQETEDCEMFFLCFFDQKDKLIAGLPLNFINEDESTHYQFTDHLERHMPLIDFELEFNYSKAPSFENFKDNISLFNRAGTSFDYRFEKNLTLDEQLTAAKTILYACDLPDLYKEILDELGYKQLLAGARYSIYHSNISDYISSFTGKKKSVIKNEIKKQERFNLDFEVKNYEEFIDQFLPMVEENFRKHGFDHFTQVFYKNRSDAMSRFMGEKLFFITMSQVKKAIGAALCFIHNEVLYIYHVGFLYKETAREWAAYFHIVFYQPLVLAEKKLIGKFKEVYFLEGADKLKISRGGTQEFVYHYLKLDKITEKQTQYIMHLNEAVSKQLQDFIEH